MRPTTRPAWMNSSARLLIDPVGVSRHHTTNPTARPALGLEAVRAPSPPVLASTAAMGFALAVVHPTYALFLWIPFAGFVAVRALWARADLRRGSAALAALVVPAALFML